MRGFIFIGDPHLWSLKPGRRLDSSFMDTVLDKLDQSAELCLKHDLQPICLGDLFEKAQDNHIPMLTKLVKVLQKFPYKFLTLDGNHDKHEEQINAKNPLNLLEACGALEIIRTQAPYVFDITTEKGHKKILLGGTSYGQYIPESLEKATLKTKEEWGVDKVLWVTHADLAFEGAYPGSLPLFEIQEIDHVINGHMHATKKSVKVGETVWHNPGNITRMSIDLAFHVPSVWSYDPLSPHTITTAQGISCEGLFQHTLKHIPGDEIFNFEGRHAEKVQSTGVIPEEHLSRFIEQLKQQRIEQRTDDATYARETLAAVLDEYKAAEPVWKIMTELCERSISLEQEKTQ